MNILIIGDSHTAQISKSLNIKSIPEGLKVSTITASNPIITKLKIRDGFLYLAPNNTSWGHKTISDDKLAVMYDISSQMIFNEQGNERLDLKNVTEFSQHQWGAYLNRAWLLRGVIFGIGVKGLIHQLGSHTGAGFGLDAGLRTLFWKRVQAGIVIQDVLTSWLVWDNGTKEIVTPRVSVGISGNYDLPLIPVTLDLMADIVIETEKFRMGMEWTIRENMP